MSGVFCNCSFAQTPAYPGGNRILNPFCPVHALEHSTVRSSPVVVDQLDKLREWILELDSVRKSFPGGIVCLECYKWDPHEPGCALDAFIKGQNTEPGRPAPRMTPEEVAEYIAAHAPKRP